MDPAAKIRIGLADFCLVAILAFAAYIDWRRLIIPDILSLGGMAGGLVLSVALPAAPIFGNLPPRLDGFTAGLVGMLTGLAAGVAMRLLGSALLWKQIGILRQEGAAIDSALGWGDVKLLGCVGAFLGWQAILPTLLVASILASLAGSALRLAGGDPGETSGMAAFAARWRSGRVVFPFGPFLAAGALAALFLVNDM